MTDMVDQINQAHREVGRKQLAGGDGRTVVLRRTYDAPIEDVWDAITDPDRLSRWFLPVSGDLKLGGTYQLEGNAGGEIVRCEPPRLLAVTWIYGENTGPADVTEVEVRLTPDPDGGTVLQLEHGAVVDSDTWNQFGPGAVGVGWDLTFVGLGAHLRGEDFKESEELLQTPAAREFMTQSSQAWGVAHEASGEAPDVAKEAAERTRAAYVPEV